jgi:hypothetical protein
MLTLVSAIAGAPAASSETLSLPAAPLPPELVALEQKMAQIHFNSERFRLGIEATVNAGSLLGGFGAGPGGSGSGGLGLTASMSGAPPIREGLTVTFGAGGEGVAGLSPPAGEFTIKEGKTLEQVRLVGGKLYEFRPTAVAIDGSRPWVSRKVGASYQLLSASSHFAEGVLPGSQGNYTGLIALIAKAQQVEAAGPTTLGGQGVSAFTASISPANLLSGPKATKQLEALTKEGITTASLETLITPAGLPARVKIVLGGAHGSIAFVVDVQGLEVPVSVKAPPRRKTITASRLHRLESRPFCIPVPVSQHKTRRMCITPEPPPTQESSLFGLG